MQEIQNILKKWCYIGVDERVDEEGCCIYKDITVCATNDDLLAVYEKHKDIVIPFFFHKP